MNTGWIYKQFKFNMSTKKMSNIMYALIMTKASMTGSHGIGIYEYDRSINCRHYVDIMIHINPCETDNFEKIAHVKLSDPIKVHLNSE